MFEPVNEEVHVDVLLQDIVVVAVVVGEITLVGELDRLAGERVRELVALLVGLVLGGSPAR